MHGNEKRISQVFWSTRNKKPMRFLIYASTLMILIWLLVSCWRLLHIKRSVSLTDGPQVAFVQSLTSVCILFCPLLRKRKRFCFAVHLFRNESQRTSPCGKDITHLAALRAPHWLFTAFGRYQRYITEQGHCKLDDELKTPFKIEWLL